MRARWEVMKMLEVVFRQSVQVFPKKSQVNDLNGMASSTFVWHKSSVP